MSTTSVPIRVGGRAVYWDFNGKACLAEVESISDDGPISLSLVNGGSVTAPRFQRGGERRHCCEEILVEDFDPEDEPQRPSGTDSMGPVEGRIAAPEVANPIHSIRTWTAAVNTPLRMAEALCMEEMAEVMGNFFVFSGDSRDENQKHFSGALFEYSRLLRQYRELEVGSDDLNALVDGHLDSAWVHLLAAATIVGPDNLAAAWSRLHHANIDGKQVDGRFVLDETGKVTKPEGWKAPTYNDLIKKEIL